MTIYSFEVLFYSGSIWNQSVVPCPVLIVASWSEYRLLKRQVRWSGIPISLRIFHSLLENEMATHSSILAWRIPGRVEPGGLLSMGSHRVGHD